MLYKFNGKLEQRGNPVILKDPDGRIIKAFNEEGKEAIHNMLSYFEKFSTSNTKKYKDVETLFALHPDNTLFLSRKRMSFHKFKKRASEHFDFKKHKKELRKAYSVYKKIQSENIYEVEGVIEKKSSSSLGQGKSGTVAVDFIPGYSVLTKNHNREKFLIDLNKNNPAAINKLFKDNNWVFFENTPTTTDNKVRGIYTINIKDNINTGETLINALTGK